MTNVAVALAVPAVILGLIGLALVAATGSVGRRSGHPPAATRRRTPHLHGPGPGGTAPLATPSRPPARYDTLRGNRACLRTGTPDWSTDGGEHPARPVTARGHR